MAACSRSSWSKLGYRFTNRCQSGSSSPGLPLTGWGAAPGVHRAGLLPPGLASNSRECYHAEHEEVRVVGAGRSFEVVTAVGFLSLALGCSGDPNFDGVASPAGGNGGTGGTGGGPGEQAPEVLVRAAMVLASWAPFAREVAGARSRRVGHS